MSEQTWELQHTYHGDYISIDRGDGFAFSSEEEENRYAAITGPSWAMTQIMANHDAARREQELVADVDHMRHEALVRAESAEALVAEFRLQGIEYEEAIDTEHATPVSEHLWTRSGYGPLNANATLFQRGEDHLSWAGAVDYLNAAARRENADEV